MKFTVPDLRLFKKIIKYATSDEYLTRRLNRCYTYSFKEGF